MAIIAETVTKFCRGCQIDKPITEFYKRTVRASGLASKCAVCKDAQVLSWNQRHPERTRELRHKSHIKREFSLSASEYAAMHKKQAGKCAICSKTETAQRAGVVRMLSVDHDHTTGAVRKLLCSKCNSVIGMAQDSPEILIAASRYLQEHGK